MKKIAITVVSFIAIVLLTSLDAFSSDKIRKTVSGAIKSIEDCGDGTVSINCDPTSNSICYVVEIESNASNSENRPVNYFIHVAARTYRVNPQMTRAYSDVQSFTDLYKIE
jgi:hypothetical protein